MELLGEFLVQNGVITPEQLLIALEQQRSTTRNLSLMAITEGFLSESEFTRLLEHQIRTGDNFADSIRALNILSPDRLEEIQAMNKEYRVPLGEVLRQRGLISDPDLRRWIRLYEQSGDKNPSVKLLQSIDLFHEFGDDILNQIAGLAKIKHYDAGDFIYREGDTGDAIYIVETGLIRLSCAGGREPLELGLMKSGDHFGQSAILGEDARIERATALNKSRVWRVMATDLQMILKEFPNASLSITAIVSRDLQKIMRGLKDRIRVFDSNLFGVVFESFDKSGEFVRPLLAAFQRELTGDIQILHNHPGLELPVLIEAETGVSPGNSADHNPGRIFTLALHNIDYEKNRDRFLRWIHEEMRHVANLIFLLFRNSAEVDNPAANRDFLELILKNSRKNVILTAGNIPDYFKNLDPNRDRVYMIDTSTAENIKNFSALKRVCGKCLSVITLKTNRITESAGRLVRAMAGREIALVLGGGGIKSAAHIGVLEVLTAAGVFPDITAGSSSGSFPAALWACGYSPAQAREIYLKHFLKKKPRFPEWTLPLHGHLANAREAKAMLLEIFGDSRTFDCQLPYLPVAVDMNRGSDDIVSGCEIWKSILASQAIPGILPLIEHEGALLADGALANNVPSSLARRYGAGFVISVNVSPTPEMTTFNHRSLAGNILRSAEVMMHQTTARHVEFTNLEIRPAVGAYGLTEYTRTAQIIDLGCRAAEEKLPELRYLLKRCF